MFKGKALLVIDRIEALSPKKFHWDIHPYIQSLNKEDPGGEVQEAFNCMEWDQMPAPAAAYHMRMGDRIRVSVSFEIHYSHDEYSGEYDFEMYLTSERVLRRQPYNDRRYRKKFYRFWKTSQTDILTC